MYARPFHSELALAGMRVLAQIISVSSCARLVCPRAHSVGSAQQACTRYD